MKNIITIHNRKSLFEKIKTFNSEVYFKYVNNDRKYFCFKDKLICPMPYDGYSENVIVIDISKDYKSIINGLFDVFLANILIEEVEKRTNTNEFFNIDDNGTIFNIINFVSDIFSIENNESIFSQGQKSELVSARKCIAVLLMLKTKMTNVQIGIILGNRDHSTVSYYWKLFNTNADIFSDNKLVEKIKNF